MDMMMTAPPRQCFQGKKVRWGREMKKLTLSELAKRTGVSKERIRQIEAGGMPSIDLLGRIANELGIDWRKFFDEPE